MQEQTQAVLFDLDGTLVETHIDFPAMSAAMRAMADAAGVPVDVHQGLDILGVVYASVAWIDANSSGGRLPPGTTANSAGHGADFQKAAFAELEELEVHGCSWPEEIPHAASTLAEIRRRGLGIGIVTRNCRRVSQSLIDRFGLTCDILLTRDDVPRVKPDPDHLLRALAKLGVGASMSTMVGDHWMDIRAGVDAGCRSTVGVLHRRTRDFYAPCPPSHYAESLADLLGWL